ADFLPFGDKLAVISKGDLLSDRQVPEIAGPRRRNVVLIGDQAISVCSLIVVRTATTRILGRHRLLDVVARIRRRRPVVSLRTHLSIHEKTIEEPEAAGE